MYGKSSKDLKKEYRDLTHPQKVVQQESALEEYPEFDNGSYVSDLFNVNDNGDFIYEEQVNHMIDQGDIEFDSHDDVSMEEEPVRDLPLFDNSLNTVIEFSMAIMIVARQKNLTDAAANVILDLFRMFLPSPNRVPSSFEKIKSIVKSKAPYELIKESSIFCASCLKESCECGSTQKSMLLIFDIKAQIIDFFEKYLNEMVNYRNNMVSKNDVLMDIHQTDYYKEVIAKDPNIVPLSAYTDGGRYTKTGAVEGWPLVAFLLDLPLKIRHKFSNILFMAYWYSPVKPNWEMIFQKMGSYFDFEFQNQRYRIKLMQMIADIPARQHLLSMVNVPGYDACYNCDIHGEFVNKRVTYPFVETHPRPFKTFLDYKSEKFGIKGKSQMIERIERFPQGFVIDPMHSVYRGPVADDLKLLLNGFRLDANERLLIKLSDSGRRALDLLLLHIKFPKEYQRRQISPLSAFSTWKASELKLFCIYIVPSVMPYLASSEPNSKLPALIESMIIYSAAIRLLTQSKITHEMVEAADNILKFWASHRKNLWGANSMTFKCHENLHLPQQVLMHGPLCTHSAFAGESAIGRIGQYISCRNMDVSVKQIGERISFQKISTSWFNKYGTPQIKKYFNFDISSVKSSFKVSEIINSFLIDNDIHGQLYGDICINGFLICPYLNPSSTDCYISTMKDDIYQAYKVMAIIETSSNETSFCCIPLKTKPYSSLMHETGFLATQPLAYQLDCFGQKNDFEESYLEFFNVQQFLCKYVLIEVSPYNFLISMPHPYEHN